MSGDNLHGTQPLKFYSTELTSTKLLLVNTMKLKPTENYEQLLQRFTKRTMQLSARNAELKSAYEEYVKNESDLKRLEGSVQAIEYCAFGKMPGDGNHDKFKDHKPK